MKTFEKLTTIGLLSLILTTIAQAQQNRTSPDSPTNSFREVYDKEYPNLKYQYHDSTQTHDYSGNWDFDGDGKNDSLFLLVKTEPIFTFICGLFYLHQKKNTLLNF